MMEPESDDDMFPAAYRRAQQEQATKLKPDAEKAGLEFEAYLTPKDAKWALAAIEKGVFVSPSEIVFLAVQQFIEMCGHPDMRQELLKRMLQKSIDDPRPSRPVEEVFADLEVHMAEFATLTPVRWEKVGQEHLPTE